MHDAAAPLHLSGAKQGSFSSLATFIGVFTVQLFWLDKLLQSFVNTLGCLKEKEGGECINLLLREDPPFQLKALK